MFLKILPNIVNDISIYIKLLADLVVVLGAIPALLWLRKRSFIKKSGEIKDNLLIRKDIKEKLREHADGYDRSEPHDIGIRLVYWKNYPWKLDDDGYKQNLYYNTNLDKRCSHGTEFLTNTGILVEEHIWFFSNSLYLGRYGTYIIAKSNNKIEGFSEVKQKIKLITTLKYKYIVNWDFEEKIEYEPVFYTKYKYTNKRLFESQFFAQNYDDNGINKDLYFYERLDRHNRVKSNKSIKYYYLILKNGLIQKNEQRKTRMPIKRTRKVRSRNTDKR